MTAEILTSSTAEPAAAGDWQAVYVFYAGSPRPLMLQCVEPLLRDLDGAGLISGYFFINYWIRGQHVRLRFKPADAAAVPEIRLRTEAAVSAFLKARPSLFGGWWASAGETYRLMLTREYPEAEQARYLGVDGRPKMAANNSFCWAPYEPEYGRYGGPAGIELAEWHFQQSSDLVIDVVRDVNLHLRTVQLGFSAQLMMAMTATFLPDPADQELYLSRYHQYWKWMSVSGRGENSLDRYAAAPEEVARVGRRFAGMRSAIAAGDLARLPEFARRWAGHCAELRQRALDLFDAGELNFSGAGEWSAGAATDPTAALMVLMSSYMHMTNNRLTTSTHDEAYLSNLLAQASAAVPAQTGGE